MELSEMVFIGFGKRVVGLDASTGKLLWTWDAPKGRSYPAVLLDGERLFVSLMGYTYCLDPYTGRQLWRNDLDGLGVGVASIATVRGSTGLQSAGAAELEAQRQHSAHSAG